MTTASGISASIASSAASLVNFGGTKMTETLAPVCSIASATEANTGTPSWDWPALRAFTPAITFAPDAAMRLACLLPSEPVMPCTTIRLFSSSQMAIASLFLSDSGRGGGELGGELRRAVHGVHRPDDGEVGLGENAAALLGVVAVETHDQRGGHVTDQLKGLDDAVGDRVAGGDPAEDVDEDALHRRVGENDRKTVRH